VNDDIISRLVKHPDIVSMLGYAATLKELVLIMNLAQGSNLHSLLFGKQKIKVKINLLLVLIL